MQVCKLIGLLAGAIVTLACALLIAPSVLLLVVCDEWRKMKPRRHKRRKTLEGF